MFMWLIGVKVHTGLANDCECIFTTIYTLDKCLEVLKTAMSNFLNKWWPLQINMCFLSNILQTKLHT